MPRCSTSSSTPRCTGARGPTSSRKKESDGTPSDDPGQRQGRAGELAEPIGSLHVLSRTRQKKGARAPAVDQRIGERPGGDRKSTPLNSRYVHNAYSVSSL